jgi:RecA/RadA recombinase
MDGLYRQVTVRNPGDLRTLHPKKSKLSLNDTIIDDVLQGGFSTKEISELVGEASSGKTQICLQLLVHTARPSSESPRGPNDNRRRSKRQKAVYFYTEGGDVPLDRLREIAKERCGSVQSQYEEILENIYTEHSFTSEDDLYYRLIQLETLLSNSERVECPVKVIVVDSIASLFRDMDINHMGTALARRSVYFFKISSLLKRYADLYDIAVVVTNHVVDLMSGKGSIGATCSCSGYFESFPGCAGLDLISNCKPIYPALGLSWTNCINARFFLSKESVVNEQTHQPSPVLYRGPMASKDGSGLYVQHILPQLRGIQVVFSPDLPQSKGHFIIRWDGCFGISKDHLKSNLELLSI